MGKFKGHIVEIKLPEGAFSADALDEALRVYLSQVVEDDSERADIVDAIKYSDLQILEDVGQIKKAKELYRSLMKANPKSKALQEGLERTSYLLN